jgi:hypothetical protein
VSGARWRIGIRFPEQQLNDPARLNYGASASAGAEVLLLGPTSDAYGASANVGTEMVLALGLVNSEPPRQVICLPRQRYSAFESS